MERPSADPTLALRQLAEAGERWRIYLRALQAETWAAVGRREYERVTLVREGLEELLGHADQPERSTAITAWIEELLLAEAALRHPEAEKKVRQGGWEAEILRVLAGASEPLRQGEVHEKLPVEKRPTPSLVYQILESLRGAGLVIRTFAPAPGGAEVAHYQLYGPGVALSEELMWTP